MSTLHSRKKRHAFGRIKQKVRDARKRTRAAMTVAVLAMVGALAVSLWPEPAEPIAIGTGKAGVKSVSVEAPTSESVLADTPTGEEASEPMGGGEASFYGEELAGRPTASGETFDPNKLTAAHRTLPLGTHLRVTNTNNGKSVVVRVNDRGPFAKRRVIDLSKGAAARIGMLNSGTARVEIEMLPDR